MNRKANLLALALVAAVTTVWVLTVQSEHTCLLDTEIGTTVIHARKTVVRPWLGPHHVYGIFVVPKKYGDVVTYKATMTIQAVEDRIDVGLGGEVIDDTDVHISEGEYPKLVYVPTRRALRNILEGHWSTMQDPCAWTLEFVER